MKNPKETVRVDVGNGKVLEDVKNGIKKGVITELVVEKGVQSGYYYIR